MCAARSPGSLSPPDNPTTWDDKEGPSSPYNTGSSTSSSPHHPTDRHTTGPAHTNNIFVSKFQPEEGSWALDDEDEDGGGGLYDLEDEEECRRRSRWRAMKLLYLMLDKPPFRSCHLETALWKLSKAPPDGEAGGNPITRAMLLTCILSQMNGGSNNDKVEVAYVSRVVSRAYRCLEGGPEDRADWRDLVACLTLLRHHKHVHGHIEYVLGLLYDMYASTSPRHTLGVTHVARLLGLPAVSYQEVKCTMDSLARALGGGNALRSRPLDARTGARADGNKGGGGYERLVVSKDVFERLISLPRGGGATKGGRSHDPFSGFGVGAVLAVKEVFRRQAWARLTQDWRVEYLAGVEEALAQDYEATIENYLEGKALRFYDRLLYRRYLGQWNYVSNQQSRVRTYVGMKMEIKIKACLSQWHDYATTRKQAHCFKGAGAISALKDVHMKLHTFKRLRWWRDQSRTARNLECLQYLRNRTAEAMSKLKHVEGRVGLRRSFKRWFLEAWIVGASRQAEAHYRYHMKLRHLHALRRYVKVTLVHREKVWQVEKERKDNQRMIADMVVQVENEIQAIEEQRKKDEEERQAQEKEELQRKRKWEAMRKKAERQAKDRARLEVQQEKRQRRVQVTKLKLRQDYEASVQARLATEPKAAADMVDSWFDENDQPRPDGGGLDVIQSAFKRLKEKFFMPPRVGHEEEEHAVTDLANIIFVYLDAQLNVNCIVLEDLMAQYGTLTRAGQRLLSHEEMVHLLRSLPFTVRYDQILDIIKKVDADSDGYIDLTELTNAMSKALEVLGVADSPWKCYVDPAHSVMCYHNILTDEKVLDYKMTDEKLMEIVHVNLRHLEVAKVVDKIHQETPGGWRDVVEEYSVRVIQRAWNTHRTWGRLMYEGGGALKVKLLRLAQTQAEKSRATNLIRRAMQAKLARRELRYLARITFEKCVDPASGNFYYVNHNNKQSQWKRPQLLTRPDEDVVAKWVMVWGSTHANAASPYYSNPTTGETLSDKPDGFLLCQRCRSALAWRRCDGDEPGCQGRPLCFLCFRARHLPQSLRMSRGDHQGILVNQQPVPCSKCRQDHAAAAAARVCEGCEGVSYCKACWLRAHRSPLMAAHRWTIFE